MYVEMVDGAYIPVGLRKPAGAGLPMVLFATGNGGGGMAMLREQCKTKLDAGSVSQSRLCHRLDALPREVDYARQNRQLMESGRQGRQLLTAAAR